MENRIPQASEKAPLNPKGFREETVRYWLSSGKRAKNVAQELGISHWSLNRWHKEMEGTPTSLKGVSLDKMER